MKAPTKRRYEVTLKLLHPRARVPEKRVLVDADSAQAAAQMAMDARYSLDLPHHAVCDIREVERRLS